MAFVITRSCCNDASCVSVCPVNCIHPTPDEPEFATSEMLYIDPEACIDCGACVPECPVDAIVADFDLTTESEPFVELNARYFDEPGHRDYPPARHASNRPFANVSTGPLSVAIVGSGPSGCYAAEELASRRGLDVDVHVYERLPVPWGLVRYGVAPDHQSTKSIVRQFARTASRDSVTFHLNTTVGLHVSHDELLQHHHAVIYAHGARESGDLQAPGADLPGSHAASDFVAWYNGHPDHAEEVFDLSCRTAVVIGNGNVALDVARILLSDPERLAETDIADHALDALRQSKVREVIVMGRRGPGEAAFSTPELIALGQHPDFDIVVDLGPDGRDLTPSAPDTLAGLKVDHLLELRNRPLSGLERRLTLRFFATPTEIVGPQRVTALRVAQNSGPGAATTVTEATAEDIATGLVLRSIGYRGSPMPGLPFDETRGVVPNESGRVLGNADGSPTGTDAGPGTDTVRGAYVTGWIKRGPSGVIGSNKKCAAETVESLLEDFASGLLPTPSHNTADLSALLETRNGESLGLADWLSIDRHEVAAGKETGRPRVKLVKRDAMVRAARTPASGGSS